MKQAVFANTELHVQGLNRRSLVFFFGLTLFRLGVLEILYDWGGVECARAVCLFISQQFLAIELSFKFV